MLRTLWQHPIYRLVSETSAFDATLKLSRTLFTGRSWQDNLALTTDRVLAYRTGRVGVCLIAAMIYIALVSVELFVPDWTQENKAEADANLAKDIYYNDDDKVLQKTVPFSSFVPLSLCVVQYGDSFAMPGNINIVCRVVSV